MSLFRSNAKVSTKKLAFNLFLYNLHNNEHIGLEDTMPILVKKGRRF